VLLGDLLDCAADQFAARFEKYNAERRERTAKIQLISRESTALWHPAGDAAKARNEMLAGLSATDLHDQVAWMHGATTSGAIA
jgi:salicylate hydroxylase